MGEPEQDLQELGIGGRQLLWHLPAGGCEEPGHRGRAPAALFSSDTVAALACASLRRFRCRERVEAQRLAVQTGSVMPQLLDLWIFFCIAAAAADPPAFVGSFFSRSFHLHMSGRTQGFKTIEWKNICSLEESNENVK